MYCCMCIYVAMSLGLVKKLCCLSMMESKGDVSEFLRTFMITFLGFFS